VLAFSRQILPRVNAEVLMDVAGIVLNALVAALVALAAWGAKGKFEALESRFDAVDSRFDRLESRLDGRIDLLQSSVDAMRSDLTQVALAVGARPRAENA
jgi:hypothetical protein